MSRKSLLVVIALAACSTTQALAEEPPRSEASNTTAWLRSVAAELRELRRELLADRLERQEARVRQLEREFHQAGAEFQNGEEIQRAQAQEVSQLDERLADTGLPAEERSQLEATRAAADSADQAYRAMITRRVTEIGEKLRREQTRLQSLRVAAQALASPPSGVPN